MDEMAQTGGARSRLSVPGYTVAIFGKSLWWNGAELFMAFFLTEFLHLTGWAAAIAIALGLITGAALDLAVGLNLRLFDSPARAGRTQLMGSIGALIALGMFAVTPLLGPAMRWPIIALASLVFRVAYAFYDLPQNAIMGLVDWSPDERRKAAVGRTTSTSAALILLSVIIGDASMGSADGHRAAEILVLCGAAIATLSAIWLWRATWNLTGKRPAANPLDMQPAAFPVALMAVVCLTIPVFSKSLPFAIAHAGKAVPAHLMLATALAMIVSQFVWLRVMRQCGETNANVMAGTLLVASAALLLGSVAIPSLLTPAALFVGCASGGLSTAIWSNFAEQVRGQDTLDVAPMFARFTAISKLALAGSALVVGAILERADYGRDAAALFHALSLLLVTGGVGVILIAQVGYYRRRLAA
jgi:glycoside/pentoside/hexuronide:cation symporter, GPH family